ncbi:hypothetical protein NW765_015172 [Fusarium oxysporum]|nr:hypothetical protein NW765_015172 [Fusarium oxysporum]
MAPPNETAHVEDGQKAPVHHTEFSGYNSQVELIEAAVAASDAECLLPKKELFSRYWPAVTFSMLLSVALVMEGMDVGLINNFFAHPAYLERFGWPDANGKQHISTKWQGAIGAGNNCGSIIGLLINGYLQSRFGSRRVYMVFRNVSHGLHHLRPLLRRQRRNAPSRPSPPPTPPRSAPPPSVATSTAWVSMCWGAGSFLATGVLRGSLDLKGDAGWRVPYGLQWMWIPPLITVAFFAPESPWYLVRRGKLEAAEHALRRLARKGHYTDESMAQTLALMKHTNEMEKVEAEAASFKDCFRGTNLRRTGIVCMAWVIQILNGQSITSFAAIMLKSIGMSNTMAFNYNMIIQSVNIIATAVAISLMGRVGRRTFYFYGSSGIGACMLIIGILGFVPKVDSVAIVTAAFLVVVQCIFKVSLGPTTYVVVAETASNRVRAQTIVLGRAVYVCGQIIVQQLNPRMLNSSSDAWNWGAKTGMFYFGLCFIWAVWIFFFLPETMNRSFADLDYLFQKKVNARKFTSTPVDLFEIVGPDRTTEKLQGVDVVTPVNTNTAGPEIEGTKKP